MVKITAVTGRGAVTGVLWASLQGAAASQLPSAAMLDTKSTAIRFAGFEGKLEMWALMHNLFIYKCGPYNPFSAPAVQAWGPERACRLLCCVSCSSLWLRAGRGISFLGFL